MHQEGVKARREKKKLHPPEAQLWRFGGKLVLFLITNIDVCGHIIHTAFKVKSQISGSRMSCSSPYPGPQVFTLALSSCKWCRSGKLPNVMAVAPPAECLSHGELSTCNKRLIARWSEASAKQRFQESRWTCIPRLENRKQEQELELKGGWLGPSNNSSYQRYEP